MKSPPPGGQSCSEPARGRSFALRHGIVLTVTEPDKVTLKELPIFIHKMWNPLNMAGHGTRFMYGPLEGQLSRGRAIISHTGDERRNYATTDDWGECLGVALVAAVGLIRGEPYLLKPLRWGRGRLTLDEYERQIRYLIEWNIEREKEDGGDGVGGVTGRKPAASTTLGITRRWRPPHE